MKLASQALVVKEQGERQGCQIDASVNQTAL
jgi:hypothetical protein